MSDLVSLVFRLPRAKLERLAALAKSTRIRQSEFLREAIADLLKKHAHALACSRCGEGEAGARGLCSSCGSIQLAWELSQCRCSCGRTHTWREFLELPAPLRGSQQETTDDEGRTVFLELRDCRACKSTMARLPGIAPKGWTPT